MWNIQIALRKESTAKGFSLCLRRVKFKYSGYSVEAVLDKLPTARICDEEPREDGKKSIYTIAAEVFGDGIDMWLRSQGENIEIV